MLRVTVIAIVLFAIEANAGELSFDVRPGLWEMTSKGETKGIPPIPADTLARLTPEQRSKMEAAMAAAAAGGDASRIRKSCVTPKDLANSLAKFEGDQNQNCHNTVVVNTTRILELHEECTGDHKMVGDIHFEASSRETIVGTVKIVATDGQRTMTSNHEVVGKWLADDCGSLKRD